MQKQIFKLGNRAVERISSKKGGEDTINLNFSSLFVFLYISVLEVFRL